MIILDYLRLVAYSVVVLTALRGIYKKKFSKILHIGDVIMASALISTAVYAHILGQQAGIWDEIFLTSGAVVWATIHFVSLLRDSSV